MRECLHLDAWRDEILCGDLHNGTSRFTRGTSRFTREQNDFKEAASAIANTESESNHTSSIRECRRLGKYNVSKTRPILVTLNSTADVSYILSHCHHLHSPISIKPDLSLQDRKAKAILLHERWKLIQSGIERKSIKLQNLSLFVNNRPYGKIINGVFSLIHARDKVATPSSNSSNTSQQVPSKVTGSTPSLPLPTSLYTSETSSTSSQTKWLDQCHQTPLPLSFVSSNLLPHAAQSDSNKLCLWNARSLVNKLRSFQSFVYSSSFSIYAITETWVTSSIFDGELLPSDYLIYRHDRPTRGWGVLIAVHHTYPSRQIPSPSHLEILLVLIGRFLICVSYIPPNSPLSLCSEAFQYFESIVTSYPQVIIVGDFNFPDICWSSLSGTCPQSMLFCDLIFQCNLTQLVDFSTHTKGGVLDLVLTNHNSLVENISSFLSPSLDSDHFPLSILIVDMGVQVNDYHAIFIFL